MNRKIMTMTFIELYTVYVKTLGQFFVHTYLLSSLNKDTSVLLKVINIWTSSLVKYKRNTMYIRTNPSIKLQNRRTRKMHVTHHGMPNGIYACIYHAHVENLLKGPEISVVAIKVSQATETRKCWIDNNRGVPVHYGGNGLLKVKSNRNVRHKNLQSKIWTI